jgi:hypothetical protein
MAVRFDNATDGFQLSSSLLDYNSAYTIAGWVLMSVQSGSAEVPICLALDGSNRDQIRTNSAGTRWGVQANNAGAGANVTGASTLSTGTWYHVALVRESTSSLLLYVDGVQETSNTQSVTGRSAQTRTDLGSDRGGSNWDGRFYAFKAWSAALTAIEVQHEMRTIRPRRLGSLYAYWPILPGATTRARDYSGNGRNWTENGTLTDEAEPPIMWGSKPRKFGYTPVVLSLAFNRSSTSTTPDTPALPVARKLTMAPTSASSTPNTVALLRAMAMVINRSSTSSVQDAAALLRVLVVVMNRSSSSSTPDTATLISLVSFAMARTSASSTPDTAALPILRSLVMALQSRSITPDLLIPWLRYIFTIAAEDLSSEAKRTFPFVVPAEDLSSEARRTYSFEVAAEPLTSEA